MAATIATQKTMVLLNWRRDLSHDERMQYVISATMVEDE